MKHRLLALAAIAAGTLALAACGGSNDTATTQEQATTAPAASQPATTSETTTASTTTDTGGATTGPEDNAVKATVDVVGGEPQGGVQKIEVSKGQDVEITVSSDEPHEIHLHGYDIMKDAAPGKPARFAFDADIDGVFEMEIEDTETQIANLVVNP